MERKVGTQHLKTGMYICGLDRPWLDTPFPRQGHLINDDNDIAELKEHCKYVYIDTERGIKADTYFNAANASAQNYLDAFLDHDKRQSVYEVQKPPLGNLPEAEIALEKADFEIARIMDNTSQDENLDIQAIRVAVRPLLDDIIDNVDTLSRMSNLGGNESVHEQATDNCALAMVFGRHLRLYKEDMKVLALGMLLLDELKNPWDVNPRIDLSTNRVDENGIERNILRTLKPGAYGIGESQSACR